MGLLGDIAGFGKGVIENNLKLAERAANFFASQIGPRLIRSARSPVMVAGQQTIESMKRSTGIGDPESGQRFGDGADQMGSVGQVLASAFPDDSWDSGGASAYAGRNTEQVGRVQTMLGLDTMVAGVLSAEADQIAAARDRLDGHSDWLGAMSLLTTSAGIIPGFGTAAQMSAEVAMVAKAVSDSSGDLKTLRGHIDQNAAALRTAAAQYATLAGAAAPNGGEFAPRADEDPEASAAPGDPEAETPGASTSGGDAPSGGGASGAGAPSGGGGGAPSGGGGGAAPTGSPTPASTPSMPSAVPASATPPSSAAASEAAGALGGILGSLVSPLGGILGGILQAAGQAATQAAQAGTQAAQLGTQAAGQAGGTGADAAQLDKVSDGLDADGRADEDRDDPDKDDQDGRDEADDKDGEGREDQPEEGRAGAPPTAGSAGEPADPLDAGEDDRVARTLPPDLEAVAAGSGVAGQAPVHVGADFEQGQLHVAAAATLDRGVPGSAAVIDR